MVIVLLFFGFLAKVRKYHGGNTQIVSRIVEKCTRSTCVNSYSSIPLIYHSPLLRTPYAPCPASTTCHPSHSQDHLPISAISAIFCQAAAQCLLLGLPNFFRAAPVTPPNFCPVTPSVSTLRPLRP